MKEHSFAELKQVAARMVELLQHQGLTPFLCGSVLLGLYAGAVRMQPQDIDLAFRSREEQDRAVHVLEQQGFQRMKHMKWESEAGDESVNTVFLTTEGVLVDVSYSLGDLALELDPGRTIELECVHVAVLSLRDLKKSYERFLEEKSDAAMKLAMIEELLKKDVQEI